MTDFRSLCAELLAHAERAQDAAAHDLWMGDEDNGLFSRARAALAEPEPERPTRQELKTFACEWWRTFGYVKDKATCGWIIDDIDPEHFVDFMDDTLAKWGNHPKSPDSSMQPIPVSERLPGPEDCDSWDQNHPISNVWCWWWDSNEDVWVRDEADTPRPSYLTHWIPAHALPLPD